MKIAPKIDCSSKQIKQVTMPNWKISNRFHKKTIDLDIQEMKKKKLNINYKIQIIMTL